MGSWGSSTDLVEMVTCQVVVGRPSHVADCPMSLASADFLHRLGLPLLVLTRVHEVLVQTDIKVGQPAVGFGRPATPWAHWSVAFGHCLLVSGTSLG
jgi:hypothetical protein